MLYLIINDILNDHIYETSRVLLEMRIDMRVDTKPHGFLDTPC